MVFKLSCSEKSYTGTCQVLRPPIADADGGAVEEPIEAPYPEGRPRGSVGLEVLLPHKGVAAKKPEQPQSPGSA